MFKCTPEVFAELVEHEDIFPAPYVGRYKWVSFERLDVLPWTEVTDLMSSPAEWSRRGENCEAQARQTQEA